MEVRVAKSAIKDAWAETYSAKNEKGEMHSVIILDKSVLSGNRMAGASIFGHELTHAALKRAYYADGTSVYGNSPFLSEEFSRLQDIYIAEDLRARSREAEKRKLEDAKVKKLTKDQIAAIKQNAKSERCEGDQTALCQDFRYGMRIWEDKLSDNPPKSGEFKSLKFNRELKEALKAETENGHIGTERIIDIVDADPVILDRVKKSEDYKNATDAELAAREIFNQVIKKTDAAYRADHKEFELPKKKGEE